MVQKSHILSLAEWADRSLSIIQQFLKHEYRLPDLDTLDPKVVSSNPRQYAWTEEASLEWIQVLLDELFNKHMEWAKTVNHVALENLVHQITTILTEGYGIAITDKQELHDKVYELIDPMYCLIDAEIERLVSPEPWWIWQLTYRYDTVFIESVRDYRIQYFMDNYETV